MRSFWWEEDFFYNTWSNTRIALLSSNIIGKYIFYYVISYSAENKEGESGTGDNTILSMVDGQIVARKYIAEQQKVVTYRLNPEKITEGLKNAGSAQGQMEFVGQWLKENDFQNLIRAGFFTAVESVTCPQGYGYTINCKVIGNPLITPPNEAFFGENFPDQIGKRMVSGHSYTGGITSDPKTKWFIRKVTHDISMSGYFSNVEIVDAFSISPTGELF